REGYMLNMLAKESFASMTVRQLAVEGFASFRDARRAEGRAASTIRNNRNTISAVYEWLIHEKKVQTANPIAGLRAWRYGMPQPGAGRERRLRQGEEERIW